MPRYPAVVTRSRGAYTILLFFSFLPRDTRVHFLCLLSAYSGSRRCTGTISFLNSSITLGSVMAPVSTLCTGTATQLFVGFHKTHLLFLFLLRSFLCSVSVSQTDLLRSFKGPLTVLFPQCANIGISAHLGVKWHSTGVSHTLWSCWDCVICVLSAPAVVCCLVV